MDISFLQSDPAKLQHLSEDPETGQVTASAPDGDPEAAVDPDDGCLTRAVVGSRSSLGGFYTRHRRGIWMVIKGLLFLAFNAYLIGAIINTTKRGIAIDFCDGVGFLIIITGLAYAGILYYYVLKPCCGKTVRSCFKPVVRLMGKLWSYR